MSDKSTQSGGIGALGLLGILFVALKLIGIQPVAEWSWVWVTAPFWAGFAVLMAIMFLIVIVAVVRDMLGRKK